MSKHHRKLHMEVMEARQMMAGDVTACIQNGTLYLTEASGQTGRDNSVYISQLAPGKIRVTGDNTDIDRTISKVNGAAYADLNFSGPLALSVKFGGGSDAVAFDYSAFPTFTNVDIDLAAPPLLAQPLALKGGVPATTTPDRDRASLLNGTITGNLTINTGIDNDSVAIQDTLINGNISVNTGAGADMVTVYSLLGKVGGNVDIQLYSSLTETDADAAWLSNDLVNGNINIRGGGGADEIHVLGTRANHDINLDAGAGDDHVAIDGVAADNFFTQLGDGNDSLSLNNLYVTSKTQLDGGAGNDSLTKTGVSPTMQLTQTNFEWLNGRPVLVTPPIVKAF